MNITVLIFCIIGGAWALGVFFTYVTGMGKSFQKTPSSITAQAARIQDQQHQASEDARTKQQQMMDDIRQKIADGKNRY